MSLSFLFVPLALQAKSIHIEGGAKVYTYPAGSTELRKIPVTVEQTGTYTLTGRTYLDLVQVRAIVRDSNGQKTSKDVWINKKDIPKAPYTPSLKQTIRDPLQLPPPLVKASKSSPTVSATSPKPQTKISVQDQAKEEDGESPEIPNLPDNDPFFGTEVSEVSVDDAAGELSTEIPTLDKEISEDIGAVALKVGSKLLASANGKSKGTVTTSKFKFNVIGAKGEWRRLRINSKRVRWVNVNALIPNFDQQIFVKTELKVRTEPSTGSATSDYINWQNNVAYVGEYKAPDGSLWYRINYYIEGELTEGWIGSKYVTEPKVARLALSADGRPLGQNAATSSKAKQKAANSTSGVSESDPGRKSTDRGARKTGVTENRLGPISHPPIPRPKPENLIRVAKTENPIQEAKPENTLKKVSPKVAYIKDKLWSAYTKAGTRTAGSQKSFTITQKDRLEIIGEQKDSDGDLWYQVRIKKGRTYKTGFVFSGRLKISKRSETAAQSCDGNCGSTQPEPKKNIEDIREVSSKVSNWKGLNYSDLVKRYENSGTNKKIISNLLAGTHQYRDSRRRITGKKAPSKSISRCYMYIKFALLNAKVVRGYLPGGSAKIAGPQLERQGYVNLLKTSFKKHLKGPLDAPDGAIIVYSGGRHGHIEVKTGSSRFTSDYSGRARTGGNKMSGRGRKVIGIYIKPSLL